MKPLTYILVLLLSIGAFAANEWRHKASLSLEYGKRYDSNLILPDSVTGSGAVISEVRFRPSFLLQYSPRTMVRALVSLGAEESNGFPECGIANARLELQFKHFFSHLTMVGVRTAYDKNVSSYAYYQRDLIEAEVEAGHYLNAETHLQFALSGTQLQYPDLYRLSLSDMNKRSHYYDYRQIKAASSVNHTFTERFSSEFGLEVYYRDYFQDTHDSDYVGFVEVPQDTYLTPRFGGGYDTTYVNKDRPIYAPNIRQKDLALQMNLTTTVAIFACLNLRPGLTIRFLESNDDYYSGLFYSPILRLECPISPARISLFYQYEAEIFPERSPDQGTEQAHAAGLETQYRFSNGLLFKMGYFLKDYHTPYPEENYRKRLVTASLLYSL